MTDARLERIKTIAQIVQPLVTVLAILIGGLWTYKTFVQKREAYPRLKIEHRLGHKPLPNGSHLLLVDILLSNTGTVMLPVASGDTRVLHMLPLLPDQRAFLSAKGDLPRDSRQDIAWRSLAGRKEKWREGEMFVEPGEGAQLHYEFVVPQTSETVAVYSYFRNPTVRGDIGWETTTVYDFANSR